MSRSYPIWNKVQACIYQSNKSYGAKDDSNVETFVGTSAKNSHLFLETRVLRVETENEIIFKFYVDGIKLKEAVFKNKKGKASGEPVMQFFNNFATPQN
jgi:hypothetical protein